MATNRELEARVQQLEALIEQIAPGAASAPSDEPTERPDYIEFGTPQHAAFIGLVLVNEDGKTPVGQRILYQSEATGQLYCLEDELGAMRYYPGLNLDEVVPVVLRQKVGVYEAGKPSVPDDAPPLWVPTPAAELVL